jgi:type II secretory pathway pseudopilin PulG
MAFRRGSTLIEVLAALGVISVGLFASANLVLSNLALVDRDLDEVVAVNLAREALEVGKQVRDSNWLAGRAFDTGIVASGDGTLVPEWRGDALQAAPAFDAVPNAISDSGGQVVRLGSGMFANRTASVPAASVSSTTAFRRLVTAQYLCMDAAGTVDVRAASAGCGSDDVAGLRLRADIQWTRSGSVRKTSVYADLYDWK